MLGFCPEVDENWALTGYYAVTSGNSLPAFWYNLSVPSSRVKNPKRGLYHLFHKKGSIVKCRKCLYSLCDA
jgi:hypothetical protein